MKHLDFYLYFWLFWYFGGGGRRLVVIVGAASPQQPNNPPKQNNQPKCMDLTNNNECFWKNDIQSRDFHKGRGTWYAFVCGRSVRGRVTPVCIHIYIIYSYVKYIIYIQNKKLSLYLSLLYIYIYGMGLPCWVHMCVFSSFQVASGKCSAEECIEKLNILHFRENPPPQDLPFQRIR